jgi:hypothetical protein
VKGYNPTRLWERAGVNPGEIGARIRLILVNLIIPPIKVSRGGGISLSPSDQEEKVSGSDGRGSFSVTSKRDFPFDTLNQSLKLISIINYHRDHT